MQAEDQEQKGPREAGKEKEEDKGDEQEADGAQECAQQEEQEGKEETELDGGCITTTATTTTTSSWRGPARPPDTQAFHLPAL